MKNCATCGYPVKDDDKFCTQCGNQVSGEQNVHQDKNSKNKNSDFEQFDLSYIKSIIFKIKSIILNFLQSDRR